MGYQGGSSNGGVDWSYYDNRFDSILEKYLPDCGEGENMATQIVTAVNKLVYKWYNDGDVFDNTYHLEGWCNDLSSYANWLWAYADGTWTILQKIRDCVTHADYENLLKELADKTLNEEYLKAYEINEKIGSVYDCQGNFKFEDYEEEEDDYWDGEEDEYDY